jgi:NTE family protein
MFKIAIACQGGGSHAAFAAGVLIELLGPERRQPFELVALSGTSGGAMCAALAWRGLVSEDPEDARRRLRAFWHDLEALEPGDVLSNYWGQCVARAPLTVDVSPYWVEPVAEPRLRHLLRKHLELEPITRAQRRAEPKLFIGATDVLQGQRVIFEGESLTYDDLIASAAVPPLFRAVRAGDYLCWDGLFTTNPPVREFTDLSEPPDEIWVIQINPQQRTREPRSAREIKDRTNELSGNLSLGQELYFVDKINRLLDEHESLQARYKKIRLRVVELEGERFDYPSKLDRQSDLIEQLIQTGKERAAWFLDERSTWPREKTAPARNVVVRRAAGA